VIWGSDRSKFGTLESALLGKQVCATGVINFFRGRQRVILHGRGPANGKSEPTCHNEALAFELQQIAGRKAGHCRTQYCATQGLIQIKCPASIRGRCFFFCGPAEFRPRGAMFADSERI